MTQSQEPCPSSGLRLSSHCVTVMSLSHFKGCFKYFSVIHGSKQLIISPLHSSVRPVSAQFVAGGTAQLFKPQIWVKKLCVQASERQEPLLCDATLNLAMESGYHPLEWNLQRATPHYTMSSEPELGHKEDREMVQRP